MSDFLADQLPILEAQITAYQNAITALATGGMQSYTLNTGQTVQTVTRLDIDKLQTTVDALLNRHTVLSARCNGGGVLVARPAW
jgi:hypothetical protein